MTSRILDLVGKGLLDQVMKMKVCLNQRMALSETPQITITAARLPDTKASTSFFGGHFLLFIQRL